VSFAGLDDLAKPFAQQIVAIAESFIKRTWRPKCARICRDSDNRT